MPTYGMKILRSIDQLFNAVTGGSEDECFSSRCWRHRNTNVCWSVMRKSIDWVADILGDPNHCKTTYLKELNGGYLPESMRPSKKKEEV